jgi:hypothetical protein
LIAAQNDTAFEVKWKELYQAVDTLETLVNYNLSVSVNSSFLVASRVQSNVLITKEVVSTIVSRVREGYQLLNTTVDQRTRVIDAQMELLNGFAANLGT